MDSPSLSNSSPNEKKEALKHFFPVLARDNRAYAGKALTIPLVISNGALRDYEVRDCCRVVRNRHMNPSSYAAWCIRTHRPWQCRFPTPRHACRYRSRNGGQKNPIRESSKKSIQEAGILTPRLEMVCGYRKA